MRIGIAGNNVSAITLAKRLRDRDPAAGIEIFSKEPLPYYQRPKLIDFLAGSCPEQDLFFYPPSWYEKNRIIVNLGEPVLRVDPAAKKFVTPGREAAFDSLVLATGSSSFVPPVPGADLGGVFSLRTLDDCRRIKDRASRAANAVIIGGGVLGLETANAFRRLNPGLSVTVLELMPSLLPRQLDAEGAAVLASLLEAEKIPVRTGVSVTSLAGGPEVRSVELRDGSVPADLVVFSAGVRPDLGYLKTSGLRINRGVVVDDRLETSAPGVFCVGDAAEHRGSVYGIIRPALDMAEVAAANILAPGSKEYRGSLIAKNTKVLGSYLLSIGEFSPADGADCTVVRATGNGEYRKFVIRGGALAGFLSVGRRLPENRIQQMIASKTDVSAIVDKMRSLDYNFD